MKNLQMIPDTDYSIIEKNGKVHVYTGKMHQPKSLSELFSLQKITRNKLSFITPFSLMREEKGYEAIGDEAILALEVQNEIAFTRDELLSLLPDENIELGDIQKMVSNEEFGKRVSNLVEEINNGELCQATLSREFRCSFESSKTILLSVYKKLLTMRGQYMTYLFHTGEKVFLGASPERHLTVENNKIIMNPIAGTLPKLLPHDFYKRLISFLGDKKEDTELAMVIDEELKMVLRKCASGKIDGPLLKEIGAVIHTEANLVGKLDTGVSMEDILRETIYAPTLVGGPLKAACSKIAKYEQESRQYYGGAFGILDEDFLDTCIVIRTAMIDTINNILSVRAGGGIVQGSTPELEVRESIKKSEGFFGVFASAKNNPSPGRVLPLERGEEIKSEKEWVNYRDFLDELSQKEKKEVDSILKERASELSQFYFDDNQNRDLEVPKIKGKKFLLLNNEDDFIFMLGFMIRKMGGETLVKNTLDYVSGDEKNYDVVVLGPGPGDINDETHPIMNKLGDVTEYLINKEQKLLGVCLGHQAICKQKGFEVKRQEEITQGAVKNVSIDGKNYSLGFYNSFSPVVKDGFDGNTFFSDRVLIYSEENIASMQFHPESILSKDGFEVLKNQVLKLFLE